MLAGLMAFISMLVCEWLGKQHDLILRPAVAGESLDERWFQRRRKTDDVDRHSARTSSCRR